MKTKTRLLIQVLGVIILVNFSYSCKNTPDPEPEPPVQKYFPVSDALNAGNWILNEEVSDEFDADELDENKWLIQGRDGEYKSNFIGRAPSQFSTENVRLENGKLMLETRWDPDFAFSSEPDKSGTAYENITTAAVISRKYFRYGYMEIKCKAADASITSSFWATGTKSELDVFEFMGKPAQSHKVFLEKEYKFSIHDWGPVHSGATVWTDKFELDWRVADDFHVYGCEWDKDFLSFYADGELVKSVTREELGEAWVLNNPMWVWVDSETFPWHGLPKEGDLPVDFEIEYIRIWQK